MNDEEQSEEREEDNDKKFPPSRKYREFTESPAESFPYIFKTN